MLKMDKWCFNRIEICRELKLTLMLTMTKLNVSFLNSMQKKEFLLLESLNIL